MAVALEKAKQEQKAGEERIRSIIRHLPVGTVSVSPDEKIESINPKIEELFGYTEEQLVGGPLQVIVKASDTESGALLSSLRNEAAGKFAERDGIRKNRETFPIELTVTRFENVDGEHFLISLQDISEKREIEQMKQDFVAMVSHDLRTPLGSILATLTLVEEGVYGELNEKGKGRITGAQQNAERLTNLVNNLLDLEKMEA
ncbi:MAG: PAS domain S-box protein, partial [bacterium]